MIWTVKAHVGYDGIEGPALTYLPHPSLLVLDCEDPYIAAHENDICALGEANHIK
uniref:Uncharacterized protein n=1 Tax=Arundo donax TaxID=35708 RepID=A0A0A9GPT3_ARUDO